MKKILQLGANHFQITVIKAAKNMGCHVITADYLPENPGHRFSDEYHNVSTIDKDGIFELAKRLNIDAIVSYASDISAPIAAYVAEKLGLPTNPYESVVLLTRKDLTKNFLKKHNFNVPKSDLFYNIDAAYQYYMDLNKTSIIKPVDSNGSKGVSIISDAKEFDTAFSTALTFSREKKVIVEEFIQRDSYQIAGDAFIMNGEVVYFGFMNEHFDKYCNPLVPIGESFPSILSDALKDKARTEINRFMHLLDMKSGPINMDFIVNNEGEVYIIEIGPRSGGNLITDIIAEAEGINLAECMIRAALGEKVTLTPQKNKQYIASYIIHASKNGALKRVELRPEFEKDILMRMDFNKNGDYVNRFDNAALGLGALLFKNGSIEEMLFRMDNMQEFIQVITE